MSAPAVSSQLQVFLLPDLGEGLTEAELVSWLVAEGDAVAVDQPIAEVETAKSVVEVPSPFAGTVAVLHGRPGEVLDVGAPFLSVRPEGAGADMPREADGPAVPSDDQVRADAGVPLAVVRGDVPDDVPEIAPDASSDDDAAGGSGNVLIGYGTPGGLTGGRTRVRKSAGSGRTASSSPLGPVTGSAPICVSPLVRKLARDNGVMLTDVAGSGEKNLILRRDIEQAIAARTAPVVEPAVSAPASSATAVEPSTSSDTARDSRSGLTVVERTPLRGVRRTIADAMTRSRREIPEATVWVDVDATELVALRAGIKRATPDAVPSTLSFVARFVVAGLARYPELNSRLVSGEDGSQELVRVDGVNLGIAAQTDRGLVVPSVRRADTMTARQLDAEIRRLAVLARDGKATPSDLSSGTFTLNNYGVFGVDGSAAIINHPESAILGMGRIIDRPWVIDGQLAVRKVTELTLAFDHRVCDGGTAGGFLRFVADAIENPGAMLADL